MANHIRIKTGSDDFVHVDTGFSSYTLCGLETDGDSGIGLEEGKYTKKKIDCPHCIEKIKLCKSIKSTEYKH